MGVKTIVMRVHPDVALKEAIISFQKYLYDKCYSTIGQDEKHFIPFKGPKKAQETYLRNVLTVMQQFQKIHQYAITHKSYVNDPYHLQQMVIRARDGMKPIYDSPKIIEAHFARHRGMTNELGRRFKAVVLAVDDVLPPKSEIMKRHTGAN
jgi:hypothetical protein